MRPPNPDAMLLFRNWDFGFNWPSAILWLERRLSRSKYSCWQCARCRTERWEVRYPCCRRNQGSSRRALSRHSDKHRSVLISYSKSFSVTQAISNIRDKETGSLTKNNWTTPKRSQSFMCFVAFVIDELLGGWASSPPLGQPVTMSEVESQARFAAQNNSPGYFSIIRCHF